MDEELLSHATDHRTAHVLTTALRLRVDSALHKSLEGTVLKGVLAKRPVAVKIASTIDGRETRFLQQCRKCKNVLHVIMSLQVHCFGILITPYAASGSLADVLTHHHLNEEAILAFASQILRGVAFVHEQNIAHRDLKPDNIFVFESGRAVIGDFGLATDVLKDDLSVIERLCGSPAFMPPEMIYALATATTTPVFPTNRELWPWDPMLHDMWSLGCTFIELSGHSLSTLVGDREDNTRERYHEQYDAQTFAMFAQNYHPPSAPLHAVIATLLLDADLRPDAKDIVLPALTKQPVSLPELTTVVPGQPKPLSLQ